MHQHFFEHRNDHTLPKNVAGFEDIIKGRDLTNDDAYIRRLLFSALRGPKMLYKTEFFLNALGSYAKHCLAIKDPRKS